MKVSELIEELQKFDPDKDVCIGNSDIFFLEELESYWDGNYIRLIRDETRNDYNVIGVEFPTTNKVVMRTMSIEDYFDNFYSYYGWYTEKTPNIQCNGSVKLEKAMNNLKLNTIEIYKGIARDDFFEYLNSVYDYTYHIETQHKYDFFEIYGKQLSRNFIGSNGVSGGEKRRNYFNDCIKFVETKNNAGNKWGHLVYIKGFEEKEY